MGRFAFILSLLVALSAPGAALARNDYNRGHGNDGRQEESRGRGQDNDDSRGRGRGKDSRPDESRGRGRGNDFNDSRGRGNDQSESRGRGNRAEERAERARDFVPLERVLRQIERRYPGHQLGVSGPMPGGGGYVYRIKWLTDDGRVLYIIADAESGAILSVDGG